MSVRDLLHSANADVPRGDPRTKACVCMQAELTFIAGISYISNSN